jgi:hypothetical protein
LPRFLAVDKEKGTQQLVKNRHSRNKESRERMESGLFRVAPALAQQKGCSSTGHVRRWRSAEHRPSLRGVGR